MNGLFLSNETISISIRDFFKCIIILDAKLVLTNTIFLHYLSNVEFYRFGRVAQNISLQVYNQDSLQEIRLLTN